MDHLKGNGEGELPDDQKVRSSEALGGSGENLKDGAQETQNLESDMAEKLNTVSLSDKETEATKSSDEQQVRSSEALGGSEENLEDGAQEMQNLETDMAEKSQTVSLSDKETEATNDSDEVIVQLTSGAASEQNDQVDQGVMAETVTATESATSTSREINVFTAVDAAQELQNLETDMAEKLNTVSLSEKKTEAAKDSDETPVEEVPMDSCWGSAFRSNLDFDAPPSDERVERLKILEEIRRAQSSSTKATAPLTSSSDNSWAAHTFSPYGTEYNCLSNDLQSLQNHPLLDEQPDFSSESENDEDEVDEQIRAAQQALRDDSNSEFSTDDEGPDPCLPIEIPERFSAREAEREENAPREAQMMSTGQTSARPYIVTPVPVSPSEVLEVAPSTIDEDSDDEESRLYLERGMRFAMEHMQELIEDYDRRTGAGVRTHDDDDDMTAIVNSGKGNAQKVHDVKVLEKKSALPGESSTKEVKQSEDRLESSSTRIDVRRENCGTEVRRQDDNTNAIVNSGEESVLKAHDVKVLEKKSAVPGESSTKEVKQSEDRLESSSTITDDRRENCSSTSREYERLQKEVADQAKMSEKLNKIDRNNAPARGPSFEDDRFFDESSDYGHEQIRSSDSEDDNSDASSTRCRAGSDLCGEIPGPHDEFVVKDDGMFSTQHRFAPATNGVSNKKPKFVKGEDFWRTYLRACVQQNVGSACVQMNVGSACVQQNVEAPSEEKVTESNEKVESEEEMRARKAEEERLNEEFLKTLDADSLKADAIARSYNQQQLWKQQEQRASAWMHQPTEQQHPQQNLQYHPVPRYNSSHSHSQPVQSQSEGPGYGWDRQDSRSQYGNGSTQFNNMPQQHPAPRYNSSYSNAQSSQSQYGGPGYGSNGQDTRQQYGMGFIQYDSRPQQSSSSFGGPSQYHAHNAPSNYGHNEGDQQCGSAAYGANQFVDNRPQQSSSTFGGPPHYQQQYGSSEYGYNGWDQRQQQRPPTNASSRPSYDQQQYAPPQQLSSSNQEPGRGRQQAQGGWEAPQRFRDGDRGNCGNGGFPPGNAQPQHRSPQDTAPGYDSDGESLDDFGLPPVQRRRRHYEADDFEPILYLEDYYSDEEIAHKFLKFVKANEFAAIPTLNSELRKPPNFMFPGFNPLIFVRQHMEGVIRVEYIEHDAVFKLVNGE
ncbi:hypothetical protein CAEBREN_14964 [Caenorhabditis brenneri]|uniref:Uncharacterized protein n=1 Tax=Caenorhabditis brenneri TaxID=135651 RepID=G0MAF5_CAEBE|nr:hypothetical protein CAEBREN_14964 [Caenorhabditis brenneri]